MSNNLRKLNLTSHITFSVGWVGAVIVFLALAISGLTTPDTFLARSMCLALEVCTLFVIVPFCILSLITGLIQAIGTKWGLFKHYWIIVKLFLTIAMTILLFLHLQPINALSAAGSDPSFSNSKEAFALIDIIKKAGAAALVLISITAISIYKPWGMTKSSSKDQSATFAWRKYILIAVIALLIFIITKHLMGGGMHHH